MNDEIKRIVEAILFVSERPLSLSDIKSIIEEADINDIRAAIEALKDEYIQQNRSIEITEVAGGFQVITKPEFGNWIKKLYKSRFTDKLSGPALETLAIIAYKQPLTRAEMEAIRGVNVDGVIKTLLERELIRISGRREVIGRPIIYGTTKKFLEYFGLNSLEELPSLKDFTEQDITDEQLQQRMGKNLYEKRIVEEQKQEVENGPTTEPAQEG